MDNGQLRNPFGMILKRQNMSENKGNHFKIVPQGHNNCQLSIVNCQFGEAAKFPICLFPFIRQFSTFSILYQPRKGMATVPMAIGTSFSPESGRYLTNSSLDRPVETVLKYPQIKQVEARQTSVPVSTCQTAALRERECRRRVEGVSAPRCLGRGRRSAGLPHGSCGEL